MSWLVFMVLIAACPWLLDPENGFLCILIVYRSGISCSHLLALAVKYLTLLGMSAHEMSIIHHNSTGAVMVCGLSVGLTTG